MRPPVRPPSDRHRGFTLIELMIAVAILAIILSVALPSFMDSIRKGRRAEGVAAIAAVQQAQERWRAARPGYADNLTAGPTATPAGLGMQATTANGRYTLSLSNVSNTNYIITAAAAGAQTSDTKCAFLAAHQQGGQISYGSGSTSTIDWNDANRCWAK